MAAIRRFIPVFVLAGLLLSVFPEPVFADSFDNEFDEKPWQEIEVQLPPFPERDNLIPFKVGAVTDEDETGPVDQHGPGAGAVGKIGTRGHEVSQF